MIRAVALSAMLIASAPALAQTAFPTPNDKSAATGVVIMCLNQSGQAVPCPAPTVMPGDSSAQLAVSGPQPGQLYAPLQVVQAPPLQLKPPPWAPFRPVCISSSNPATCRPGP